MRGASEVAPASLAGLIPDDPRWIDLRGLLLTGRCDVRVAPGERTGLVAGSWDYPFAAVYGELDPATLAEAAEDSRKAAMGRSPTEEWQLLASPEARRLVTIALPGWQRRGIVLHRWAERPAPAPTPDDFEIRVLPDGHRAAGLPLDHLPEATRNELEVDWVSRRPMVVAEGDGGPVTFCYAAFTTERWWDVSIETLRAYRRRGLAAACFLALAEHLAERGLSPVWGAMEDNPASLGLAARLGFARDATMDGWTPANEGPSIP